MKVVHWYLKVMEGGIDSRTVMEELVRAREYIHTLTDEFEEF